eukprot:TRINITY_DN25999_c1_g1_i1.p1 TRINITY_DN25999_c1_g1~~TRINITY_DN25999_c1_g1_i1.p1  ORF type:complete len:446 (+),score=30.74 TRINITY_DN25999_c1_g1_i1:94-1431(+)
MLPIINLQHVKCHAEFDDMQQQMSRRKECKEPQILCSEQQKQVVRLPCSIQEWILFFKSTILWIKNQKYDVLNLIISTVGITKLIKAILSAFIFLFHKLSLSRISGCANMSTDNFVQHVSQIYNEFQQVCSSYLRNTCSPERTDLCQSQLAESDSPDFNIKVSSIQCLQDKLFKEQANVNCDKQEADKQFNSYIESQQTQMLKDQVIQSQDQIIRNTAKHVQNQNVEDNVENQHIKYCKSDTLCKVSKLEDRVPLKELCPDNYYNNFCIFQHDEQKIELFEENEIICGNKHLHLLQDLKASKKLEFECLKPNSFCVSSHVASFKNDKNIHFLSSFFKAPNSQIFSGFKNLQVYSFEVNCQSLFVPPSGQFLNPQNNLVFDEDENIQFGQIESFPIYDPSLLVDEIIDDDPKPIVATIYKQIRKVYVFGHLIKFLWNQMKPSEHWV